MKNFLANEIALTKNYILKNKLLILALLIVYLINDILSNFSNNSLSDLSNRFKIIEAPFNIFVIIKIFYDIYKIKMNKPLKLENMLIVFVFCLLATLLLLIIKSFFPSEMANLFYLLAIICTIFIAYSTIPFLHINIIKKNKIIVIYFVKYSKLLFMSLIGLAISILIGFVIKSLINNIMFQFHIYTTSLIENGLFKNIFWIFLFHTSLICYDKRKIILRLINKTNKT